MRHQIFSTYYQLSLADKVPPLVCDYVNHTGILVPRYDYDLDKTYLECLDCQDRRYPGLNLYYLLIDRINVADPYPEDPAFDKFK